MLFVRNPTGVSHSPEEHAETADCLAGVEALADALDDTRPMRLRLEHALLDGAASHPTCIVEVEDGR